MSEFFYKYGEYSDYIMITPRGSLLIGVDREDYERFPYVGDVLDPKSINNVCLENNSHTITAGSGMDRSLNIGEVVLTKKEFHNIILKILEVYQEEGK